MMGKMPLPWSDNRLSTPAPEMITSYRFERYSGGMVSRFIDFEYRAKDANRLATKLVEAGFPDGTVQFPGPVAFVNTVHCTESLHGMAALWRCRRSLLKIPRSLLKSFFSKSGRGLRPDMKEWWSDTLNPASRPWRVRRYSYPVSDAGLSLRRRAKTVIDECLDFASDQDMLMFKMRWL